MSRRTGILIVGRCLVRISIVLALLLASGAPSDYPNGFGPHWHQVAP